MLPQYHAPQPKADQLPTELLEVFFKHLDHGTLTKDYLSACSRVSRRWRAIALPFLFRAMRVRFHVVDGSHREPVVPPSTTSFYARTDSGVHRDHDSVAPRRRTGSGKGKLRTNRDPTASQIPGKMRKTLSNMHAFFTRNHQFAAYVHELQLILVCPEQDTGDHGWTSPDAGSGSSSVQYPFADPDELLAVLHALPNLQQLKLYDVALTGHPTSQHSAVNLQLLRLQFPNRAAEITDLVHYQALFSLFGFVDELWVGRFGSGLSFPDNMSSLVPVPTRARLVHMQPSESFLYPLIVEGLVSFSRLEHVELIGFADPFKPHLDYAPQDTVDPVVKCNENVLSFVMTVADDNPGELIFMY
ncbi:hypothetical protein EIP86_000884 [Pleurotus ostreatoroseus]|nr:hypothetical protein EIP86_000884 [Pleurotus ostreatoroseus]